MQEIPKSENLSKFSLTGFGLKFRAHPLAIAIANEQFSHLDGWLLQRQKYVDMFISAFSDYRFLKMPTYKNKKPSWYAFIMQFDENCSNRVSLEDFYNSLHKIGLREVDRPGSTRPIHNLPLFNCLDEVMPRLYEKQKKKPMDCSFPQAEKFYRNAIKLPVWAFADEQKIVETYIEGIKCVCDIIVEKPELFKEKERQ
jgi:dTDP-4-amino-4,6-dideoxygalactose transaminase